VRSTRTVLAIGGAAAVLVLVVGWFLLISPTHGSTNDTTTATAGVVSSNATLQQQIVQLKEQSKAYTAKQAELSSIGQQVPSDPQQPALIRALSQAASDDGVDLVSLTPGAAVPAAAAGVGAASYSTLPYTLQVEGDYTGMQQFMLSLEQLKRIFLVQQLNLAPATGAAGGSAGRLPDGDPQTKHTLTATIGGAVYTTDASTTTSSLPALAAGSAGAPTGLSTQGAQR